MQPTGSGRPVLVADDDPIALELIVACLDRLRLRNPRLVVEDGDAAIEALTQCLQGAGDAPGCPPALVLLDSQMPGRGGLDVMWWMREQPALAGVPVVMLTSDSDMTSIQDAYSHGVTSYLVKPVGFDALADVLRGLDVDWMLA